MCIVPKLKKYSFCFSLPRERLVSQLLITDARRTSQSLVFAWNIRRDSLSQFPSERTLQRTSYSRAPVRIVPLDRIKSIRRHRRADSPYKNLEKIAFKIDRGLLPGLTFLFLLISGKTFRNSQVVFLIAHGDLFRTRADSFDKASPQLRGCPLVNAGVANLFRRCECSIESINRIDRSLSWKFL